MQSQFLGRNKFLDNSQTMVNNTRFILHILKNYLITKYTNIWDNILDILKRFISSLHFMNKCHMHVLKHKIKHTSTHIWKYILLSIKTNERKRLDWIYWMDLV